MSAADDARELAATLHNKMLMDLKRSGLNAEDAELMKLVPTTADHNEVAVKRRCHGYEIRYLDPMTGRPTGFYRTKFLADVEPKYLQPESTGVRGYFAPLLADGLTWAKVFADPTIPIVITEGEKKAAAMCKAGFVCVGIGGVDNYAAAKQGISLLAELAELAQGGRRVTVIYDSDAAINVNIQRAREGLVEELSAAGADAGYAEIPHEGGKKVGLDDLIVAHRAKAAMVIRRMLKGRKAALPCSVRSDDFYADMSTHTYLYIPTRELWPAKSVDGRLRKIAGKMATRWLDKNRPIEQKTWAPGEPELIRDRLVSDGGWFERKGASCFNLYRPPAPLTGDASKAGPWIAHVKRMYPEDAWHIIYYVAHRLQFPGVKINHALVLGGGQGIGKDTILEAVKHGVGPWNFTEVSPVALLDKFNGFVKSVILRISEARDLGDVDRFAFYDHTKSYIAAPPDVLRCNEKHLREHAVMNVMGVIITTNHKTDGIYLPPDDRRHFVAWSELSKEEFTPSYWSKLWAWYESGGIGHVVAYLTKLDISKFDAKAPPPRTAAWHAIVNANRSTEDSEFADALDALAAARKLHAPPDALTLDEIDACASDSFREYLRDRRSRRQIPHRLDAAGYVAVNNDADTHDGQWKVGGKRKTIYAKKTLSIKDRHTAAMALQRDRAEKTPSEARLKDPPATPVANLDDYRGGKR